jgi:hypothetical protein
MKTYSQNQEQHYILEYFKLQENQMTFLEIGAYNPFTFSNTRALVEQGASGFYVEPSPKCFEEFIKEYYNSHLRVSNFQLEDSNHIYYCRQIFKVPNKGIDGIFLVNAAIGNEDKIIKFYDSNGDAISSTSIEHKDKWEAGYTVKYDEIDVQMMSMQTLLNHIEKIGIAIDFLNLDVESTNIELFNLIPDLFWQRLKMICIEHDNQQDYIINKLQPFGFKELLRNGENLILAK